jgi:hypothetical protein
MFLRQLTNKKNYGYWQQNLTSAHTTKQSVQTLNREFDERIKL